MKAIQAESFRAVLTRVDKKKEEHALPKKETKQRSRDEDDSDRDFYKRLEEFRRSADMKKT
jgi:hypothetical protein